MWSTDPYTYASIVTGAISVTVYVAHSLRSRRPKATEVFDPIPVQRTAPERFDAWWNARCAAREKAFLNGEVFPSLTSMPDFDLPIPVQRMSTITFKNGKSIRVPCTNEPVSVVPALPSRMPHLEAAIRDSVAYRPPAPPTPDTMIVKVKM